MRRGWLVTSVLLAGLAGCAGQPSRTSPAAPAQGSAASTGTFEEEAAAVAADAARSDKEPDAKVRERIADDASRHAEACMALAPARAACLYERAVAWGLEAKAHPTRALELLKSMLDLLGRAETAAASYDEAGPARVKALVLVRAPGWPLGPGDADAGVEAARRAVALRPRYPPNMLAFAEAQAKSGDASGARASYDAARALARAAPAGPDRDEWLAQAEQGLAKN